MKRHYHVFVGISGNHMPDTNEVYHSLREARRSARHWIDVSRKDKEVVKRIDTDYYSVGEYNKIEIYRCNELTCKEGE